MNKIISPLKPRMQGEAVSDLQDGLRLLSEKGVFQLSNAERQVLDEHLRGERAESTYGQTTAKLVSLFQEQHQLEPSGEVDERTAAVMNREVDRQQRQKPFVVKGTVRHVDGKPLSKGLVRAFDKDLRSEELLGEATTDPKGYYEIRYSAEQFSRAEKKSADLRVSACTPEGRELGRSSILFNARPEETIDLVVGGEAYRGPSEYEQLVEELTPLLQGLSFAELTEDDKHQDITFLSGETGQDPGHITFLIVAHRLLKETGMPAEVFFGLFRQGLPTQLPALLAQSADVQRRALVRSAAANIIPPAFGAEADAFVERLKTLVVRQAMAQITDDNGRATLNDLLGVTLREPNLREEFLTAYANHTGPAEALWERLATRPEFRDRIGELQQTLQLGALTGNHLPLVRELQRRQAAGEIGALADLGRYDEDGWLEIIAGDHGDGPIGVPPGVPGQDDGEKARNYARAMSHLVEDAFPTTFVARRLVTDDLPGREDLLTFFSANPEFNLRATRLESYLRDNPDALANIADLEGTKECIKAMQRVYKLAPRYTQTSALIKGGVDSAHAITRMGENVFLSTYGGAVGGKTEAKVIYAKAQQVDAMAASLLAEYGPMSYQVELQVLQGSPVLEVEGMPEWSALFGSLELCECEHCRSVYSPAAYLVDVLHFLKDRPSKLAGNSAKNVLFMRRPDIGEIELTCENTNTPLPYVDLVNEALENAIAPFVPFAPFNLDPGIEADLNSRTLSVALRNAFNPPLSAEAVITIGSEGQPWDVDPEWWAIDEPAFTYTIRKEGAQLQVVSRSLQTKGTAAERAANPQYTNASAYDLLGQAVYPWSLPFDLWAEEARAYLGHLGVSRFQIMENLQPGERVVILERAVLAREHLGLTSAQADIITGVTTSQPAAADPGLWNLWGLATQDLSPQNSIIDPSNSTLRIASGNWLDVIGGRIDVFLQQSGLKYREMLDLLDTYYVNPVAGNTRTIRIVSTDPNNPDTCETDKLRLDGLDQAAAARMVCFVRLWRALGWSMRDLDRAITTFGPAGLDDGFLTRLSHVQRLHAALDLPVHRLLSWWAEIDTAFYFDHRAPGQPRADSLYDQLFRNRATVNPPDPAFTEDPANLAGTLTDHTVAISAALGISATELAQMLADADVIPRAPGDPTQPDDVLSLERLSQLHLHASLARALRLPVRDYLAALKLNAADPFATTTDTVLFVERMDKVRDAGLTVAELDYLLRHNLTPESPVAPSDEAIVTLLDELRAGLQQIAEENSFRADVDDPAGPTVDLDGDLTRQKLALLNWERGLIDAAVATLSGEVTYQAPLAALPAGMALPNAPEVYSVDLAALPAGFEIPAELGDAVVYDAANLKLTATRSLSQPDRNLLETAANAVGDAALTNAVTALFQDQDELQGEISYNAAGLMLRFAGPMTNPRKVRLDATSGDLDYRAAVQALYDAPRRFVSRAMRTFTVHDFAVHLDALPAGLNFPNSLKRKIYFDIASDPRCLHCVGVMNEPERDALLALSTDAGDPNHAAYQAAVQALYDQPEALVSTVGDAFLTASGANNDAAALFDAPVAPGHRFLLVLEKLLPHLRRTLSANLVVQRMAEALQLETRAADGLLSTWLASPVDPAPIVAQKRRCLAELLDPAFAETNTNVQITPAAFPAQFRTFLRAHKAALVASQLELTHRQLGWLFRYGPDAGWLDLNSLPTAVEEPAAATDGWRRLAELARVRNGLPQGEKALDELLALAVAAGPASSDAEKNAAKGTWFEAAARWTGWEQADLETLLGTANDHTQMGALNATFPDDYVGVRLLGRLRKSFGLLKRLGLPAAQAIDLAAGDVTQAQARSVRQAVRAKYDEAQWLNTAKPLRDVLREQQRAALVAYLGAHLRLRLTQLETPHPVLSIGAHRPAVRELQQKLNAAGASPALAVDGIFGPLTRDAVTTFQNADGLTADGIVGNTTWAALDQVRRGLRDADDLYAHFLIDVEMDPCMMTSRIKQALSSAQLFVQRCLMNLEPDVSASADVDVKWREWRWMKNYRVWEANRKIFLYPENWIEPELRDDKSPFFRELESELLQSDLTLETAEEAFMHYLEKLDQVAHLEVVAVHHQLEKDAAGNAAVDILHVFARTPGTPHVYYYRQRVDSAYWTAWERLDLDIEGEHLLPVVWNRRLHLFWPIFTEKADPLNVTFSGGSLSSTTPSKYWEIQLAWSERKQDKWTNKRVSANRMVARSWFDRPSEVYFRSVIDDEGNLHISVHPRDWLDVQKDTESAISFRFDGCHAEPSIGTVWGNLVQSLTGTNFYRMFHRETGEKQLYLPAPIDTAALNLTPGTFLVLPHADGSSLNEKPFFYRDNRRTFFVLPSEVQVSLWDWPGLVAVDPGFVIDIPAYYWEEVVPIPDPVGPIVNPEDPWIYEPSFPVRPEVSVAQPGGGIILPAEMGGDAAITAGLTVTGGAMAGSGLAIGGLTGPGSSPIVMPFSGGGTTSPLVTVSGLVRRILGTDRPMAAVVPMTGIMAMGGAMAMPAALGAMTSPWSPYLRTEASGASVGWFAFRTENRYLFQTFYHPYVCAFVRELNRNGVSGLLQRRVQTHPQEFMPRAPDLQLLPALNFKAEYEPHMVSNPIVLGPYPVEDVDFEDGAYAIYNWELFFHTPLLVAERLSQNQRYEDAQSWFHYIFDPTDTSGVEAPRRYWHTKPFYMRAREGYQHEQIQYILKLLAAGADPESRAGLSTEEQKDLDRLQQSVDRWRKDPFKPHLIARMRTTAYQKMVVMKYIDNLIAWGDQLFRRDTIESINEATQLYILAAEILGCRPQEVPPRARPSVQTYNSLEPRLDDFSNALVQIEEFVSPSAAPAATPDDAPPLTLPTMLYFCVPKNDKLLSYWDTVADRLFKIRHCMNIEGVVRQLPLFEPPIEPGLLVKAAAAGVDLSSVLNDVNAALSPYRFNVLAQKATELCAELKSLGQAMLSALEKRDGEHLSLLRAQHETALLSLVEQVRELQLDEAEQNVVALNRSRDAAVTRYTHYQRLLGVQSPQVPGIGQPIPEGSPSQHITIQEEGGIKTIPFEKEEMEKLKESDDSQDEAAWTDFAASIAHIIPNWNIEPWGVGPTFGGSNVGSALSAVANRFRADATEASYEAGKTAKLGQYALRAHDWLLQSNLAAREIMQIDQQILTTELRQQIAEKELQNHRRQLANAQEVEAFLSDKYTNEELYGWMMGQLATVYFRTYQLAFDLAKRAERGFRHELGLKDSSFIQFGYWDGLKKGLLAGERLFHDIKRMEVAYLEQHRREYEITKHISLGQLDPLAVVQLRQTGACSVHLPEEIYDLDFPGHYMRRIKSVGVSIPCVTGPYIGVHCTLTLIRSSVRHGNTMLGGKYGRQEGDTRFTDYLGAIQSIVTSSGQNDSGLFEPNLRDERYLPFEGAGAVSEWRLELPTAFRQFDYDTISDVILHVRYTAREGGGLLKQQATLELQNAVNEFVRSEGQQGLAQMFSLRHEFPSEWHRLLNPPAGAAGDQTVTLALNKERFPFLFQNRTIAIQALELFVKVRPEFAGDHNESTLQFTLAAGEAAPNSGDAQPEDILSLAPWNALLRAAKTFNNPPGAFTLNAWLDGGNRLDPSALENIVIVCRYACT